MGTISAELVTSGEKRDTRGRRLAGEGRREALLGEYDQSGVTQREFSRREGICYHTLVAWLARRRRESRSAATAAVSFAEVKMPGMMGGLEVSLPGGLMVRGHDAAQMAALIKALR